MATLHDATLLDRWIETRDAEAFAQLVSRHATMVFATCRRVLQDPTLAEDATQDCFLKLSQAERNIGTSLGGWLHRVATNRSLDMLRSRQRSDTRDKAYGKSRDEVHEPTWDDLQLHVDEAIAALPADLQTPVVAHFLEGLSHQEIAKQQDLSRSGVTRRIQRGIELIRKDLAKRGTVVTALALPGLFEVNAAESIPTTVEESLNKLAISGASQIASPVPPSSQVWSTKRLSLAGGLTLIALVAIIGGRQWIYSNAETSAGIASSPTPVIVASAPEDASNETQASLQSPSGSTDALELDTASFTSDTDGFRLQCIDLEGNPVEGAEVYHVRVVNHTIGVSIPTKPGDLDITQEGPLFSDVQGFVSLPGENELPQPGEHQMVYARVPGKLVGTWMQSAFSFHQPQATLTLIPSKTLAGRVIVPAGSSPTDVTIELLSLGVRLNGDPRLSQRFVPSFRAVDSLWPELFTTRPDAEGNFVLEDMPTDGRYNLVATAPGLAEAQAFANDILAQLDPPFMQMYAESVIEGTVRYANARRSAAGLAVYARSEGNGHAAMGVRHPHIAITDSRGHYRINGLPDGHLSIVAPAIGPNLEWIASVQFTILRPGEVAENVDFLIEEGTLVSGQVLVEGSQEGVEGVHLTALNPATLERYRTAAAQPIASADTDNQGRYSMRLPSGNTQIYISDFTRGFAPLEDRKKVVLSIVPDQKRIDEINFAVRPNPNAFKPPEEAFVRGLVVDENGNALAGIAVKVKREYMRNENRHQTGYKQLINTNLKGEFRVTLSPPIHKYQFAIGAGFYNVHLSEWISLETDEEIDLGTIELTMYQDSLSGVVLHEDGDPVTTAEVVVISPDASIALQRRATDASGHFQFNNVPGGSIKLEVDITGYPSGFSFDVEANTDVEIVLPADVKKVMNNF